MADVTLTLKADTSEYVRKMKEAAVTTQKLYDESSKGSKKLTGIIEKEEANLKKLQEWKRKASAENLTMYNKEIAASQKRLEAYDKAGTEVEKTNQKITKSGKGIVTAAIGWASGFATVTAAIEYFKKAIDSTNQSADEFRQAIYGLKSGFSILLKSTATGDWDKFFSRFKTAFNAGKEYAKQQDEINNLQLQNMLDFKDINIKIEEQRRIAYEDDKVSYNDKLKAYDEMLRLMKIKGDKEVEITTKTFESTMNVTLSKSRLTKDEVMILMRNYDTLVSIGEKYLLEKKDITKEEFAEFQKTAKQYGLNYTQIKYLLLNYRQLSEKERLAIATTSGAVLEAENQFYQESKRVYRMRENMQDSVNKTALDSQKEYQKAVQKLLDDASKAEIDSLAGVDKLKAQRDYGLAQIAEAKKQIESLGKLTPEITAAFDKLGAGVWSAFYTGMKKEAQNTPAQKQAISDALLEGLPDLPGLRKSIIETTPASAPEDFSIWKLIGLDPDESEDQEIINSIKDTASTVMGIMEEMTQRRVDDAQRNRELLDTQIAEAQRNIENETRLYEAGYASNVAAKKKELAELEKQRALALKREEEALKRQRALDTIQQTTALITASANIFKGFSTMPVVGQILAVASIAAMFAAFAASKAKAAELTKYASGGWTGEGTKRDETGKRIAGIVHNREFVIREGPAARFREVLEAINKNDHQMVVNRFNKLSPDLKGGTSINNVLVNNDGANKRLDRVNTNLEKLKTREEVFELADATIIIRNGNKRVIRRYGSKR